MSTTSSRSHATARTLPVSRQQTSFVAILAHGLTLIAKRFAASVRFRRDIQRLSAMDDRLLGDIGISRSGIDYAVHTGRRERGWENELASMSERQLGDLPFGREPRYR